MQFTNVTVEWSTKTFVFYLAIIFGCYTLSCILRNKSIRWGNRKKKYPVGLIIVTLILLYVKCFNTTGRDIRAGYVINFASATSMGAYRDQTVEPGFRLLMVIIHNLTNSYPMFLFIVGLLTVLPVIHMIHKYRDKIEVPAAILFYISIYFFNSFSSCRQCLAVSLSLFAFDAMVEKKPYKALVWIVISSSIHIACAALLILYVICFAKVFSKKLIAVSAALFFVVFYYGRGSIATLIGGNERYSIYSVNQHVRFGFEQIVYYAPLFLLLYICRKDDVEKNISHLTYIYLLVGFAFGMFGYVLPIFGRMQSVFMPIYILIPYYIKTYNSHHHKTKSIVLNLITITYCVSRFVIWITQYYNLEDLMPYTNVFDHII